jgi:hypothetical protein
MSPRQARQSADVDPNAHHSFLSLPTREMGECIKSKEKVWFAGIDIIQKRKKWFWILQFWVKY